MISETTATIFNSVIAGVFGGLVLRLAQIISKKINKKEDFLLEFLITIGVAMAFGISLFVLFN